MENARYAYYAFISYNHRDSKQAKWIQEELENFKFPTKLKKDYGSRIPDSLRPIFRDATDLNAGVLEENLKRELLDSRFLIVVCSPESAQSEWVNKEVEFFIQNGRGDQIIPLIVAGKPDAADEKEQCFVPALRNLKKEILGISIPELGAEKALVKVVAKMLSLKFDQLWQRHERQKRRAKRIKRSLAFIMLLLLIGSGFFAWDYNREKISYYADFVDKWGVPTGIIPLTEEQVAHRQGSYRFVSKQGKTRRVEYVNSHGMILKENRFGSIRHSDYLIYGFYVPVNMKINYHENGEVSNIAYFNERNARIFDLRFSKEGQNFFMEIKPRKREWEKNFGELAESKVRMYSVTRDSSGFISRMMYRNAQGYLVWDKDKSFGESYTRNSRGQILSDVHLDKSGQQMEGDFKYESVYDSLGHLQERSRTRKDEEKRSGVQRYSYDCWGNLISHRSYDDDGNPQYGENGIFEIKYEYDDFGNLIKETSFGINKELVSGTGSRWAYVLMDYNEKGLVTKHSVYGIDGEPVMTEEGWFTRSVKYSDKGRPVKINYLDKEGADVSEERYEYDNDGNIISQSFFDAKGNLTEKDGYASAKFEYDDKGNPIKLSYFDAQNAPATDIAEIIAEYDEQGNETKISIYDKDGQSSISDYNEYGSLIKESYYDAKGVLTKDSLGYAVVEYGYDQYGNISSECFYDENQNKISIGVGFACVSLKYDKNGNAIKTVFEGTNGNAVKIKHGFSERRNEYDEKGNIIEEKYFDTNGNLVINDDGYASLKKKYNKQDKLIEESYYDAAGKPIMTLNGYARVTSEYDDFGDLIEDAYFDTKGRLVAIKDTPCARVLYEYDERNRLIKKSCRNVNDSEMYYTVTTYEGSKKNEKKYRPSGEPWDEK